MAGLYVQLHLGSLIILSWAKTHKLTRSTSLYMASPSSSTSVIVQLWSCIGFVYLGFGRGGGEGIGVASNHHRSMFMLDSPIWCRDSSASSEWLASKSEVNQPFSEWLCVQVNKPAETPNRRLRRSPEGRPQWGILSVEVLTRSWRQLFTNLDLL